MDSTYTSLIPMLHSDISDISNDISRMLMWTVVTVVYTQCYTLISVIYNNSWHQSDVSVNSSNTSLISMLHSDISDI